jgi:hypothetical protein
MCATRFLYQWEETSDISNRLIYKLLFAFWGIKSVNETAQMNAIINVAAVTANNLSNPATIHITVVTNPDTRDAIAPRAVNLFQKNEKITAGAKEQPIPAHAK